jgi:hypothetical protein
VAEYVTTPIKGRGEPIYAECSTFFGPDSRVCNIYKKDEQSRPAPSAQPGTGTAEPIRQGG